MKNKIFIFIIIINFVILARVIELNINNKYIIKDNIFEGMTAPRGRILDINGNILVDNIGVKSLIFNKLNISNKELIEIAYQLSDIIDIDYNNNEYNLRYFYYLEHKNIIDSRVKADILKDYSERKITSEILLNEKLKLISDEEVNSVNKKAAYLYYLLNKGYSYEDKIIKKEISDHEYNLINLSNIPGIRTEITWERYYPYGDLLKDVFGSVSSYIQGIPYEYKDYYLKKGYKLNDRVGITNLEYIYDDYLRGKKAKYKEENNRFNGRYRSINRLP